MRKRGRPGSAASARRRSQTPTTRSRSPWRRSLPKPSAANPARALLNNQNSLVLQQCKLAGWQIIGERTGAILKALTALAGVTFLLLAGLFAWSASQADGVVVTPFAVPPEMERRGLTGPVVAAQLLDRLTRLEEQTESMRIRSSYANDWGEDIAVEILMPCLAR
jgi:hypothetical protein